MYKLLLTTPTGNAGSKYLFLITNILLIFQLAMPIPIPVLSTTYAHTSNPKCSVCAFKFGNVRFPAVFRFIFIDDFISLFGP
jgi:hypothetical protein